MSETTSILDLPTDPAGGGNNISLKSTEMLPPPLVPQNNSSNNNMNNANSNNSVTLDQSTITQIVNGLQQATITGATKLPSRDIPMTTNGLTQDPYIQPNYVPPSIGNYIDTKQHTNDIINDYTRYQQNNHTLDDMYTEIQTPLLLAILFFLFQLPFFKRNLFLYFPVLFSADGNMNFNGYVFNSILFGLIFYMLNKVTSHFGTF